MPLISHIKKLTPLKIKRVLWFLFKAPQRSITKKSIVADFRGIGIFIYRQVFPISDKKLKSISICTGLYNRSAQYLGPFLQSIEKANHKELIELSVFDCGSDDVQNLEEEIRKQWKGKLVFRTDNVPFTRAYSFNRAVEQSTSEIVFLCDADMSVPKDIVRLCNQYTGKKLVWFPVVFYLWEGKPEIAKTENGYWKDNGGRGMMACRKSDFTLVGKLNEDFKAWGKEDDDLWESFVIRDFRIIRNRQRGLFHNWHSPVN